MQKMSKGKYIKSIYCMLFSQKTIFYLNVAVHVKTACTVFSYAQPFLTVKICSLSRLFIKNFCAHFLSTGLSPLILSF